MQLFQSQEASDGIMAFMARKKARWGPKKDRHFFPTGLSLGQ